MKMFKRNNTPISLFVFLFISCADNETTTDDTQLAGNASVPNKEQSAVLSTADGNIVGEWKLILEAYDENENKVLDEEERKKGFRNNYLLRLNANGTCRIQNFYNGTYTIKEEGGRKILSVQREKGKEEDKQDPPDQYYIISLIKDELILLSLSAEIVTTTFWVFNRTK
jgi:hypothetical protein